VDRRGGHHDREMNQRKKEKQRDMVRNSFTRRNPSQMKTPSQVQTPYNEDSFIMTVDSIDMKNEDSFIMKDSMKK